MPSTFAARHAQHDPPSLDWPPFLPPHSPPRHSRPRLLRYHYRLPWCSSCRVRRASTFPNDLADPLRSYAQSYYTLSSIYSGDGAPPTVHTHLRSFDLAQVPLGTIDAAHSPDEADKAVTADERKGFDFWTRERWIEKDQLLDEFYKAGEFPAKEGQRVEIPIGLRGVDDWVSVLSRAGRLGIADESFGAARRLFKLCRSVPGLEDREVGAVVVVFVVASPPPAFLSHLRNLV